MLDRLHRWLFALALALAPLTAARAQTTDSTTSGLQLLIMGVGLHQNDWGVQTSSNLQKLESALVGLTTIATTGGTTTLTDDQARARVLQFTGTLSSNATIVVPARLKDWRVLNATTGAYTLSIQPSGGTASVIPATPAYAHVLTDGSAVFLPGTLVASNNLSDLTNAATARSNLGVTATGADPAYLLTAGGTMSGGLNMGGQALTNLATPSGSADAVTKTYADTAVTTLVPAGAVMAFNLSSCPTGWKIADGTSGTADLRGQFVRGLDTGGTVDPSRTLASAQTDTLQNVTGNIVAGGLVQSLGSSSTSSGPFANDGVSGAGFAGGGGTGQLGVNRLNFDLSRAARTSTETRPKNVALLFCQKS